MALRLIEAARALVGGAMTSRACTEHFLARIRSREPSVQAWVALDEGRALALAGECDRRLAMTPELGALHGVPIGVKDVIDTADLPTQMGTPAFAGHQPGRDAAVVER